MFFDPATPAEDQNDMRKILASILPKNAEDVKMVAAALKIDGIKYEEVFLEWVAPFGRFKAKGLWARAKPDPDAMTEVLERQLTAAKGRDRFKPHTAADLEAMPTPQYRIKGVLPAEGLAVVYGSSGSAKSFLCISAAAAIASGMPFFGYATAIAPVLYVALEGEAGYRGRVIAWQRHNARTMPDGVGFLLQPFRLTDEGDVADLAGICPPAVVIIIDTLNRAAPGTDENSGKDMGNIIQGAKQLQRLTRGLVVLVSHTGKDASKGLRGHSSLFAALDAALLVQRNGALRSWKIDKAKDGQDGREHGFHLKPMTIGIDEDGDEITSAVVIPEEMPQPRYSKPLTGNRQLAMNTLKDVAGNIGKLDSEGNFAGAPLNAWREEFYRKCSAENEDGKRKAFNRARNDLAELGMIAVNNDMYYLAGPNADAGHAFLVAAISARRDTTGTLA